MWEVARLYGIGARKYTRYGECECAKTVASESPTHAGCVVIATTDGLKPVTLITLNDSEQTHASGRGELASTSAPSGPIIGRGTVAEQRRPESTVLLRNSTSIWSANRADFADESTFLAMLTTTMRQTQFADPFATVAILELVSLKSDPKNGSLLHLRGCPALSIAERGENNWRKGYDWSNSYAALQRHASRFWAGESMDEGGFHHLAAVVFHALALLTFEKEHPELDDRFHKEAPNA